MLGSCDEPDPSIYYRTAKKNLHISVQVLVLALPIFPGSHPPSIVGANELNFCVRDGNRWTLTAINTNSFGWLFTISYVKSLPASNSFWIITPFCTLVKIIDKR